MLLLRALILVAMLTGASAAPAAPDPVDEAAKAAAMAGEAAEEAEAKMARLAEADESYEAIAWAPEHMNYSISAPSPTRAAAEAEARDECQLVSRVTCTIAASGRQGAVKIGLAEDGSRVAMEGYSPAHAAERVVNECASRGRRCTAAHGAHMGALGATIKLPDMWGTIAYRSDRFPKQVERVWAVSQQPSQQAAILNALELCQRKEKAECTAKAGVRNVDIGIFAIMNERGTPLIESDIDEVRLKMAIDFKCRQMAPRCLTFKSFNVREPVDPEIMLRIQ
jgi:Domain of unknown function (DUF4189)